MVFETNKNNDLYYIYTTLRELKAINEARDDDRSILNVAAIFPRRFLLKLVDQRLVETSELSHKLVASLFKRLISRTKKQLPSNSVENEQQTVSKRADLEKYFHYCLYYLHDFFIELDWHESGFGAQLPTDKDYAHVLQFSLFQKALTDYNIQAGKLGNPSPNSPGSPGSMAKSASPSSLVDSAPESSLSSPSKGSKSFKSSLSSTSKINSPTRGRRVKFRDSPPKGVVANNKHRDLQDHLHTKDNLSILALDLLIYGLNLFIEDLCNHLNDWYKSELNLKEILAVVSNSKHKLRTQQLESISRQVKTSNDIYLTVLDHLAEIRDVYLEEYVLGILCADQEQGGRRTLCLYKRSRVKVFVHRILAEVERKVLVRLASQCLQLSLDLMVNEINLPPLELEQPKNKSRENHSNFITSWLNVDDIVFGFVRPSPKTKKSTTSIGDGRGVKEVSTLQNTDGLQFKSSSRILNQMDNLQELIRHLLGIICDRLLSKRQLAYFLGLIQAGFQDSFDTISRQLWSQMSSAKREPQMGSKEDLKEIKAINKSVDLIAAKVRCLKLVHILTSVDRLVREMAQKVQVELADDSKHLETKLIQFAEKCAAQQ